MSISKPVIHLKLAWRESFLCCMGTDNLTWTQQNANTYDKF